MNSPPSSPSSSPSFDVYWRTENLLLPHATPSKLNHRLITPPTLLNTTTTTGNNLAGIKRNSTLATLPSPTSISRIATTSTSTTSETLTTGRNRLNKKLRRTRNNSSSANNGTNNLIKKRSVEIGLDEDTLKTLGVLTARLGRSSSSGTGSSVTKPILKQKNDSRNVERKIEIVGGGKGKGKEREVVRVENKSISRHSNENNLPLPKPQLSTTSNRLLPPSLTKFRPSSPSHSTSLPLPPPLLSPSKPIQKIIPTTSNSTSTKSSKKGGEEEFDEYFDSADDEFFELALSQLETSSIIGSSALKKSTTTVNRQQGVGIPNSRILVAVAPVRSSPRLIPVPLNNNNVNNVPVVKSNQSMKLPTNLPPPRINSTSTSNLNNRPQFTRTPTFRFSGPSTRTSTSNIFTTKSSTLTTAPATTTAATTIATTATTTTKIKTKLNPVRGVGLKEKEKLAMEELLRKEMEGLEEMVGEGWSDDDSF